MKVKTITHIAIFVTYSGQGGAERVVNLLSRGFLERGVQVDLPAPVIILIL